jgi:hypothetical protein
MSCSNCSSIRLISRSRCSSRVNSASNSSTGGRISSTTGFLFSGEAADQGADETKLLDATVEFLDSLVWVLQWQRREWTKTIRMFRYGVSDMIVRPACYFD